MTGEASQPVSVGEGMTWIEKLRDAMRRLDSLLADPYPGLATWRIGCEQVAKEVEALLAERRS